MIKDSGLLVISLKQQPFKRATWSKSLGRCFVTCQAMALDLLSVTCSGVWQLEDILTTCLRTWLQAGVTWHRSMHFSRALLFMPAEDLILAAKDAVKLSALCNKSLFSSSRDVWFSLLQDFNKQRSWLHSIPAQTFYLWTPPVGLYPLEILTQNTENRNKQPVAFHIKISGVF